MKMIHMTVPGFEDATLEGYILDCEITYGQEKKRPAIIVCPGGGYVYCSHREGEPVALSYAAKGFHAFVLRYSTGRNCAGFAPLKEVSWAVGYLREHAEEYQIDTDSMYLIGHSMGGFAALNTLARGADVKGAVLIAPCDLSHRFEKEPDIYDLLVHVQDGGYFHTATETSLDEDVRANAEKWRFPTLAEQIDQKMPIHFIGGRDDTITPPQNHIMPMLQALQARGMNVSYAELPDGHSFPGHRIALTKLICRRIAQMEQGE